MSFKLATVIKHAWFWDKYILSTKVGQGVRAEKMPHILACKVLLFLWGLAANFLLEFKPDILKRPTHFLYLKFTIANYEQMAIFCTFLWKCPTRSRICNNFKLNQVSTLKAVNVCILSNFLKYVNKSQNP